MDFRFVRLIAGSAAGPPGDGASLATAEELHYLRERRGEKIAALDEGAALLGSVSLVPDRDEGGSFVRLAGIDVAHGRAAAQGLDAALLEEARRFLQERRMTRLKLGTSPLLTHNASLYITRLGARYRWREGIRTPEGAPYPWVTCECDFEDPCARPLDLTEEEVGPRSVLSWDGLRPLPRGNIVYAGPLSVLLPEIGPEQLAEAGARDPQFYPLLWKVFHELSRHGYCFSWFDRREAARLAPGEPSCYYVMSRVVTF